MKRFLIPFLLVCGLSSCARDDIGAKCRLTTSAGNFLQLSQRPTGDVATSSVECTGALCLSNDGSTEQASDGVALGYCSQSCTSNADCPRNGSCESVSGGSGKACWYR